MSSALLPPNATPLERAMADAIDAALTFDVPIRDIWNPATCPADFLPWLAWTFSVDYWDASWIEERKRAVIAESLRIHRTKGSIGSVRRLLAAAGVDSARIVERLSARHDGKARHDGSRVHDVDAWARWRVYIRRPLSIAQGQAVRGLLETVQPVRCHLEALEFTEAVALHDGLATHDGSIQHGGMIVGTPLFHDGQIAHDGTYSHGAV